MAHREQYEHKDIALIDILDTVLDKGVAIQGDIVISIAGIDLVYLDVRILLSSVETLVEAKSGAVTSDEMDVEKEALAHATKRS